jgi:hypothetical protein
VSNVTILKNNQGRLQGLGEKDGRAYGKWKRLVDELEIGQTLTFSYRFPRSPKHHRLFFAKLQSLLSRTEAFDDLDKLRYWTVMGAGYFDLVPGFDGTPNAIPQSLDFDSMDEAEFTDLHRQVDAFLWTARAQQTLWPALSEEQRYACVESWAEEFAR